MKKPIFRCYNLYFPQNLGRPPLPKTPPYSRFWALPYSENPKITPDHVVLMVFCPFKDQSNYPIFISLVSKLRNNIELYLAIQFIKKRTVGAWLFLSPGDLECCHHLQFLLKLQKILKIRQISPSVDQFRTLLRLK